MTLTREEKKIVAFLEASKDAGRSSEEIAARLDLAKKNILKKVNRLKALNIVSKFGTTRVVRYRLSKYDPEEVQKTKMYRLIKSTETRRKQEDKKRYKDNAEFRSYLLSSLDSFLIQISHVLDCDLKTLEVTIDDEETFKKLVLHAKMRSLSKNILFAINDYLKEGLKEALTRPHAQIEVYEQKMIKNILDEIDYCAPNLNHKACYDAIEIHIDPRYEDLSFSEELKNFVNGDDRNSLWDKEIRDALNSYGVILSEFIKYLDGIKIAHKISSSGLEILFDADDLEHWIRNLRETLSHIIKMALELKYFLDKMQKEQGQFRKRGKVLKYKVETLTSL